MQDTAEFAGFELTNGNVLPRRRYLQNILDFPSPKNIADVRSWFGLVCHVSCSFGMAEMLQPFRQLIKPGTPFRQFIKPGTPFRQFIKPGTPFRQFIKPGTPFRQLIKPGTLFRWDTQLENLFQEIKVVIVSEIEERVKIFDKSKPTCLETDWLS